MKPPRFPLPHWLIFDAPALATARGPVYRAAIVLGHAYWRGGCRPLAADDVTLASLCREPLGHFRQIKTAVLQALSEITPALDKAHAERMNAYQIGKVRSEMLHAARARKRAERLLARNAATGPQVPLAQPQRLAPERSPSFSRRPTNADGSRTFSEKPV